MPERPKVGAKIRRARKLMHLTQQQAADKVGVSRATWDSWENDRSYPARYDVALEQALGIDLTGRPAEPAELTATDEWERSVLEDRYLPDDEKRWLITQSREARLAYVAARRARREQDAAGESGRSGHGTEAG